MKNLKSIIQKNGYAIGSWINTASPIVAEIMANAGFDFLTVDAEHSPVDINDCRELFQAIKSGNPNCVPMVRLHGNTYADNKRYLDAGSMGLIAPLVRTKAEAKLLVNSAKYPPAGERGVGYCRANGYGFGFDKYIKEADEDIFICVQIEHIQSIYNLDEIFSVKGIDAAFIGPYDMTASMGITAQFEHPEYRKAVGTIKSKCDEYGIIAGVHVVQPNPEEVKDRIDEGFRLIAYSLDITMLGYLCREGLRSIKNLLGE